MNEKIIVLNRSTFLRRSVVITLYIGAPNLTT